MSALSIKNKLTIAFVLAILVMTTAQTYITGSQIFAETTRSINQYATTLLNGSVNSMDQWIKAKINVVRSTSDAFIEPDQAKAYLATASKAGDFRVAYAGLNDAQFILGIDLGTPEGYDPRERDWYKDTMRVNGVNITEPYFDVQSNRLIMTIALPFKEGNIGGVLGADVEIDNLVKDVVDLKVEGVEAFITNSKGKIVAHKDKQLTLKEIENISPDLTAAQITKLAQSQELVETNISNTDVLITSMAVPNTDWYYTIVIDKAHAFKSQEELLGQSIMMGLAQVLLIGVIAFVIVKRALAPLNNLSDSMKDLAEGNGDLTKRIEVNTKDEIGILASQVNAFIAKLQEIVQDISNSSNNLGNQSEVSTKLAIELSDSLATQLNEVSQIATAVHEMSAAAEEVASNAKQTADSAFSSTDHCDQGKRVIRRNQDSITTLASQLENAAKVIGQLERNAQDINTITSTISDIAEQTNLLALNAAIEAARAGDQGRGFAVVADEVRVLSQRTHSSTVEIREMIESLQRNSLEAVESMTRSRDLAASSVEDANDATEALEKITISIQQISEMASHISNASSEQRTVTEEVSKNIQQVSDISTHLSQEAHSSRSLSEDLRQIAVHLDQQVNLFKY
ncbi:methyl-accepting chemotaxis protein [Vibrio panuliri]|uniref:Chemotaxis protein n=1 Tax=Vibrio panuliri TaxID=1381081 RepID=A0A1Q9H9Z8_9VIBR|nr:methyl-accepting chemotaxis protein [Vibrio panuliri]KAB1457435.1 methyl-accepting chemotaxis protein [Vibrio panuliri]OLQ85881.1 chemotaxis protein [Vibrio panuliri]OLQ91404.1 chemotaxis protein [Vibrio panuliri]